MQNILLHLPYFGSVLQASELIKPAVIFFENEDNYQKQTYRNRMYIYDSNGKLSLTIPVKHSFNNSGHQKYKNIRIENDFKWQQQHWRSLKTAYQTSPFFEFYEDELAPLYHQEYSFLMDFNYDCLDFLTEALQLTPDFRKTDEYIRHPEDKLDKRELINAKTKHLIPPYTQVFEDKHGFLPDLCILDLLFCEGPNTSEYLKKLW